MVDTIRKLLASKNMGAVVFDGDLTILQADHRVDALLRMSDGSPVGRRLPEIFPELIGSEAALREVLERKAADWRLDYVNRTDGGRRTRYLDLLVLADERSGRGLLIVDDVTDRARAVQELNQNRYELLLYKRQPASSGRFLHDSILGHSAAVDRVRETIDKLSRVPKATVLLLGESGTGKSLAARVIHYSSMAVDAPFVDINCAALPENLIESELFGYVKGAFTHATGSRPGLMEAARGGTVFLDEIGELPLTMQVKLLSVLETKKFRRLGSNRTVDLKARIIAATNRDLERDVAEKRFREDLFYRLNVVSLTMPPLRAMVSDIPLIADHLVSVFNVEFKKQVRGLSENARQVLVGYTWPGNVRELSNCLERAMIFVETDRIRASDLLLSKPATGAAAGQWHVPAEGVDLEDVERRLIVSALEQADGNKSRAARLLGLSRDTLRYRLEKYRLV